MNFTSAGPFPEHWLALARDAGIPAAVVAALSTLIALWQFARGLGSAADAQEYSVLQVFAKSPRRVRSLAMFAAGCAAATATTMTILTRLLVDERIAHLISQQTQLDADGVLLRAQVVLSSFFVISLWWALRNSDAMPDIVATYLGLFGVIGVVSYGLSQAWGLWADVGAWVALAYGWWRSLHWASNSAGSLARAIQRG